MARFDGTDDADEFYGAGEPDFLYGRGGDDILAGGGGDDIAKGGNGDDWLDGGSGNDRLTGGLGSDTLNGGSGDDWLEDTGGDTTQRGGFGNDTLRADLDDGALGNLDGGDGDDTMILLGGTFVTLRAAGGYDVLRIEDDIALSYLGEESGFERIEHVGGTIFGTDGNDSLDFTYSGATYVSSLGLTAALGRGDDYIFATGADDVVTLSKGNDFGWGLAGDDVLRAGAGNDDLRPGDGDDVSYGGDGDDHIIDGIGDDTIYGGAGDDWLESTNPGDFVLSVFGGAGDDFLAFVTGTFTALDGGTGVDELWLSGSTLTEFGAENRFENYGGNFSVYGTDGANVLDFSTLTPGSFSSGVTIDGRAGNDRLSGSIEGDRLSGGLGDDTFAYTSTAALAEDRILDFASGDLIDLSAIDADPVVTGDQAIVYLGTAAFTGQAGELRAEGYSEADGWRYVLDSDGDGAGDVGFFVTAADPLLATDFVL